MACDSIQNCSGMISNVAMKTEFTSLRFLPPANEVWGKVMFLHLCAILFMGGGWLPSMHHRSHDQGVCLEGDGLYPGKSASRGRGRADQPFKMHGNKRAVHILLECILVSLFILFHSFLFFLLHWFALLYSMRANSWIANCMTSFDSKNQQISCKEQSCNLCLHLQLDIFCKDN